ncbi:unnamed protein product [Mesocestoides corti]|uniref:PHD-type domain-containing protein n=1 Tax=Mesocestoides corti TaxID=53468 RepID=A0A0R3UB34_MESCO|nr:unnamed protein product [Mesocestoides corti]
MKSGPRESKLGELISSITRRDPSKRQIKPVNTENILLDDIEDESDDDDESDSGSSGDGDSNSSDSDSGGSCASHRSSNASAVQDPGDDDSAQNAGVTIISEAYPADLSQNETPFQPDKPRPANTLYSDRICMLCLGDQSNLNDEIIECDACKIVVHEGTFYPSLNAADCHKVYDDVFLSSSASSSDTDPWFCEPCLAGVENPVTLTELPSKDWSSKECTLCEEKFFAWTGVCISCDAGLCKNFFHVTCAQREGLLAEPAYEENPSDPYFAQCRQHTDKQVAKARRRNYLTAVNRCRLLRQATEMEKKACASVDAMEDFGATGEVKSTFVLLDERLKRKLETFRTLYQIMLDKREVPYTRPTKAPLYLENSPVAMRLFMAKAVSLALPIELTGSSAVTEASKSTAPGCPVFCPDFISYVLDREKKLEELSKKLTSLESIQRELQLSDANVSHNYNCGVKASESLEALLSSSETAEGQGVVRTSESARSVSADDSQSRTVHGRQSQSASTQCSQKRTRKLPLSSGKRFRRSLNGTETIVIDDDLSPTDVTPTTTNSAAVSTTPPDNIFHQCNICNGYRDQHLLTICETCKKAFHIACLDPPLSRVPKRSKLFAWQVLP